MNPTAKLKRLKRWAVSLLGVCVSLEAIIVIVLSVLIRECIVNARADKFDTTLLILVTVFSLVLAIALITVSTVLFKVIKALRVPLLTVGQEGVVAVPDGFTLTPPRELIPPWDRYLELSYALVRLRSTPGTGYHLFVLDRADLAQLLSGYDSA